jgi:EAL domain-containing protein (putative c-di-GMP-specific phosphodiesterase class I)
MRTNKIIGFEALLRWNHPQKGLLYPDQFLPQVNSEKKLMLTLGEWVVNTAFEQLSHWRDEGHDFALSINLSAHEFKEDKTFSHLQSLLEKYPNLDPNKIEFEILETHAFDDIEQANKMIKTLQKLGFNIALDDFGTGYSTLTYLKDFSINTLKIDKSFVMDMLHDRASLSILEATLGLADAFGCEVIAEGVESVEHGVILIQLGCYQAQGYVLSKAMPSNEVIPWLNSYKGYEAWEEVSKRFFHDNSALYATVEHREWIKNLENYLKGYDKNALLPELDENKCNFSKWLDDGAKKHFSQDTLNEISNLHKQIHNLAREAVAAPETKKADYIDDIDKLHLKITNILDSYSKM